MMSSAQRQRQRRGDPESPSPPRRRRNQGQSDDEPENVEDDENAMDEGDRPGQGLDQQLAKNLVRYALSCEYSRTPIRRDGIKEKVLGSQGRAFRRVFELAQGQLRAVWGMELRELPVKDKVSLRDRRQAIKANSQPKSGSGTYVLSSTLPEAYRAAGIIRPSKTPSSGQEASYVAFYTLVVSIIYLNSGEISDQRLQRHLARMNAEQNVLMEKTDLILKKMERQQYIVKKVDTAQDGEHQISWTVGPRAREEIGADGVAGVVREVWGGSNDDLDTKLQASLGQRSGNGTNRQGGDGLDDSRAQDDTMIDADDG